MTSLASTEQTQGLLGSLLNKFVEGGKVNNLSSLALPFRQGLPTKVESTSKVPSAQRDVILAERVITSAKKAGSAVRRQAQQVQFESVNLGRAFSQAG